ncbi:alpha/beta fold hydrolase [Streptomyces erythrochromogenes]|uniref:alpha/beta fold hydrolase n=1 Tax=Streptomyces erythrochromogenes TaxID=285574 RepID=UPI0036C3056B
MSISPMESGDETAVGTAPERTRSGFSRRAFVGGAAAAAAGVSLVGTAVVPAAAAPVRRASEQGFGSVSTAPRLPAGFTETFKSRFVQANGIRQHVVVGGDGPPLLLVHGWPQNWYAWRLLMPELAKKYTVVVPDQRGIGLTEKPAAGYDTKTLADDLAALMRALGHERFAVAGHDTGLIIGYALAADHPGRVARLAVAEVPGPPGTGPSPELFIEEKYNNKLWHIPFNRVDHEITEKLVRGREDLFFGYEFDIQGGKRQPEYAREYYVRLFSTPEALRGGFGLYRAWDTIVAQNKERARTKLTMPVLAVGGAESWGPGVGEGFKAITTSLQTVVVPGAGHWIAEQAPAAMLDALGAFLAPYRAGR